MLGFLRHPNDCFARREDLQSRGTVTGGLVAVRFGSGPAELCSLAANTMPHPRFRGANAAYRTVHATFPAVEAPFRTSSAGLGSPGPCFRTSLARFRAVEGRIRTCEAREKSSGTQNTASSAAARGAEARIAGRNRLHRVPTKQWTITPWRAGSVQSPVAQRSYSPITHASNPKRRFRPTRAHPRLGLPIHDARRGGPTPRRACHTASTLTSAASGT